VEAGKGRKDRYVIRSQVCWESQHIIYQKSITNYQRGNCWTLGRIEAERSAAAALRGTEGRSVDPNWDVLGMRATRSDSLILEECWLPDSIGGDGW